MSAAWYPAAQRRAGPAWKTSGDRTSTRAAVYHSVEGSLASALAVLDGSRESSWQLTNPKVGKMLQHYPLGRLCWHAKGGNAWSPGVENEGRAGQALTENQVQNLADFSAWLVEEAWLKRLTRTGTGKSLFEHNEVPGSATVCPSGRIPWAEIIRRAEEEDEMKSYAAYTIEGRGTQVWAYRPGGDGGSHFWRMTSVEFAEAKVLGLETPLPKMSKARFDAIRKAHHMD